VAVESSAIGKIQIEAIRTAFPKEASHLTTWLEQHVDVLCERLGIELTVEQREAKVGSFNVDLLCEDANGNPAVIENQLEPTDHDHLGKLLTYLVNMEAATAVWVTSEARPEHEKVIDWLNESTPADISFYLVKAEAVRIDGSAPAPLFTVVAGPSEQIKKQGDEKKDWAERHYRRVEFWKGLLDKSKGQTTLFANISPGTNHWISTGVGKSGITLSYLILKDRGSLELYVDCDSDQAGARNKAIFDALLEQRAAVEEEYGKQLEWMRLDNKRASKIRSSISGGGLAMPDTWDALQDRMITEMVRFEKALVPRLKQVM
jgi:hypothetical protein